MNTDFIEGLNEQEIQKLYESAIESNDNNLIADPLYCRCCNRTPCTYGYGYIAARFTADSYSQACWKNCTNLSSGPYCGSVINYSCPFGTGFRSGYCQGGCNAVGFTFGTDN